MSDTIEYKRVAFRRDVASNWQTLNPLLHEGEVGLELDPATRQVLRSKFGPGHWLDLPYAGLARSEEFRPEDYGAVGDGVADDSSAVHAARMARNAAGRGTVVFTGDYRLGSSPFLDLGDGESFHLAPGSRLIRNFTGTMFRNASFAAALQGLTVTGTGTIYNPNPATYTGIVFNLRCDDLLLQDVRVNGWAGGLLIGLVGDRCRIAGIKAWNAVDATGNGGIRFAGGRNFRCYGCHVESGDDTYQFVPVAASGGSTTLPVDQNIRDAVYSACTGSSSHARFMVAGLVDTTTGLTMTAEIDNSGWVGCHGKGGARGFVVQQSNSAGRIDVTATDCSIDMTGTAYAQADDWKVAKDNTAGLGPVRLRAKGVSVKGASGTTSTVNYITGTNGSPDDLFEMIGCKVSGNATQTQLVITSGASPLRVIGGVYDMKNSSSSAKAFTIGTPQAAVDANIDTRIINVPSGTSRAVDLIAVAGARIRVTATGTPSTGIRVQAACSKVDILPGTDVSAATTPLTNNATDTTVRGVRGVNPKGFIAGAPAVPASTVAATNTTGHDCTVFVAGGTVTAIAVGGTATGITAGAVRVPANQTITLTYSVAPTWKWFGD